MATHSSILAWRVPMGRGVLWAIVHGGCKELDGTEVTWHASAAVIGLQVALAVGE